MSISEMQKLKLGEMKYVNKQLAKHPGTVDKLAICTTFASYAKWRGYISLWRMIMCSDLISAVRHNHMGRWRKTLKN